jgi:hypothetical protein
MSKGRSGVLGCASEKACCEGGVRGRSHYMGEDMRIGFNFKKSINQIFIAHFMLFPSLL